MIRARLKRIGVLKAALIAGFIYLILGLLFAIPYAGMLSTMIASKTQAPSGLLFFVLVVIIPTLYGIVGFIGTAIFVALYNLAARWFGGIEVDAEPITDTSYQETES